MKSALISLFLQGFLEFDAIVGEHQFRNCSLCLKMIPYVALALLLNIAAICAEWMNAPSRKKLYWILGCVLCTFILVRDYHVCLDFIGYKQHYEFVPSFSMLINSFPDYLDNINTDFSFSVLCSLLKTLGNSDGTDYIIIFSIYGLLGVSLKLVGINKLSDLKFQVLFLYVCKLYLLNELTQIRAGVAIGLIFISIYYLRKDKYWQFFGLVALSTFFHFSSMMMFFLPLFHRFRANAKVWGTIFLLCVAINVCKLDLLSLTKCIPNDLYQYKLAAYIYHQQSTNVRLNYFSTYFILQNIVILLCFVFRKEMEKENTYLNIILNMCCLSSCCFVLLGSMSAAVAMRVSEMFNGVIIILIPHLVRVVADKVVSAFETKFKEKNDCCAIVVNYVVRHKKSLAMSIVFAIGWGLFYIYACHCTLLLDYQLLW